MVISRLYLSNMLHWTSRPFESCGLVRRETILCKNELGPFCEFVWNEC